MICRRGRMDMAFENKPYESTVSLDKEVTLLAEDKGVLLEKGEHTFSFQIIVPSTTATTIGLQSQNIMVGGLLLLRFNLVSPPSDVEIYGVKVKINQHFHLRSSIDPKHTYSPPADVRTVAVIDSAHPANYGKIDGPAPIRSGSHAPHLAPLAIVKQGEGFKPGTETGIVVEHTLAVEITYRNLADESDLLAGKGKEHQRERRKLVVSKPLDIFSVRHAFLTLPVYAILDPHPEPDVWSPPCVCGLKLSEIIKRQGDTLLREEGEEGITFGGRPYGNLGKRITSPARF
ncbi:hypothetical protein RQP46_008468 [Phenoliferia psychrophenolica]